MSLREKLNRNPSLIAVAVIVAVGVCGWVVWSQISGDSAGRIPNTNFYTTDDGKTLFTDASSKLAPFDKDGKQAVRAHVYRCPDGNQVVAYLERYTEKGKAVLQKYHAEQKTHPGAMPPSVGELIALGRAATEVKRPQDKDWINASTNASARFIQELQKCSNGEPPAMVIP